MECDENRPRGLGRSRRTLSSVETMVRRLPTSSWTASPNLGQERAFDGAFAESGVGKLAGASGCGDLDLVAVIVEFVLNNLLNAVFVWTYDLARWQRKSRSSPSSSSSSPHRSFAGS
ncbi:putative OTU domain-containing protein 3 [Sesbania bispinosa]|nr:putative OTU domain-containing protein 3 [Sesbania bispinosa]